MNQGGSVLKSLAIVLASTLAALVIGLVVVYGLAYFEDKGRWEQLATPPGDIVSLVAGDPDHVIVVTDRARTYQIQCRTHSDYSCVDEVVPPRDVYQSLCDPADFPEPTGQVKDRLLACFEHEYRLRSQYVVRDDGTLWRWKIEIYPYGQLARFVQIMILSLVAGVVAGLVIAANRRR